ncbi:hypothetical protein DA73_0400001600 [Tolypothrix bouteillei VB521301]|uniref:Uncharacterized protein n=3 Tax=Nostocales TaxID=1161 RepID=A0A8S9SY67_9CYAN|nr:hypothetical protein DA73_0400001600 [Tolypothrix bouteillei VB521301]
MTLPHSLCQIPVNQATGKECPFNSLLQEMKIEAQVNETLTHEMYPNN